MSRRVVRSLHAEASPFQSSHLSLPSHHQSNPRSKAVGTDSHASSLRNRSPARQGGPPAGYSDSNVAALYPNSQQHQHHHPSWSVMMKNRKEEEEESSTASPELVPTATSSFSTRSPSPPAAAAAAAARSYAQASRYSSSAAASLAYSAQHNSSTAAPGRNEALTRFTASFPDETDFDTQHEGGALQFVPALQESSAASAAAAKAAAAAASWDVVLDDTGDEEKKDGSPLGDCLPLSPRSFTLGSRSSANSSAGGSIAARARQFKKHRNHLTQSWPPSTGTSAPSNSNNKNYNAVHSSSSSLLSSPSPASPTTSYSSSPHMHRAVSASSISSPVEPSNKHPTGSEDEAALLTDSNATYHKRSLTDGPIVVGQGGRIGRIASMFSSRALVRGESQQASSPLLDRQNAKSALCISPLAERKSPQPGILRSSGHHISTASPPSPVPSSSSSGYVGWPGTQDKRGKTVQIQSSNDDSSAASSMNQKLARRVSYHNRDLASEAAAAEIEREVQTRFAGARKEDLANRLAPSKLRSSSLSPIRRPRPTTPTQRATAQNYHPDTNKSAQPSAGSTNTVGTSMSAMRYAKSEIHSSQNHNIKFGNRHASPFRSSNATATVGGSSFEEKRIASRDQSPPKDPWGIAFGGSETNPPSSPSGSSISKTSSAYFQVRSINQLAYPDFEKKDAPFVTQRRNDDSRLASASTAAVRAALLKKRAPSPQPPTQEALAVNDHLTPPHRTFIAKGYSGLIDKTKEVPSLMDAIDSESMSSKTNSAYSSVAPSSAGVGKPSATNVRQDTDSDVFDGISIKESDVFDNLSHLDSKSPSPKKMSKPRASYPERIEEEEGDGDFKVIHLGGGLTAIQTTANSFSNRKTANDFDETLTNSEVDQNGFTKIPGFHEMISSGIDKDSSLYGIHGNIGNKKPHTPTRRSADEVPHESDVASETESESSLFSDPYDDDGLEVYGDLSKYYVHPSQMKKLVRRYRQLSDNLDPSISLTELEREEDEHKAFALFEMRSRIMEKDIERGLERRGGTVVVDDIMTTPHNLTSLRIRDAIIVSKAWRDGASPRDIVNSAILTRRAERCHFIKRRVRIDSNSFNDNVSFVSGYSTSAYRYTWEPVKWLDDTDFMLYRCPSLGPRHMHGFEMFTIGDCQSILLKLTNEQCMNLRRELNESTKQQIEAEELLKEEGDTFDEAMTEAEMAYLTSMEEVKTISKKLVAAEKAFALVRDRIEKLVAKYESLLAKIETDSFAGASSIITYESSYYSDYDSEYWEELESKERVVWARRAKRAELRAEVAAREALMAKQEARMIREEKQRELEALQQKLFELQSESSYSTGGERGSALMLRNVPSRQETQSQAPPNDRINREKLDGVKQRFRDRMAAKKQVAITPARTLSPTKVRQVTPSPQDSRALISSVGEEMFQHLNFYERSLQAVESTRHKL